MLDRIEAAEGEITGLEARLADPATYKGEDRSGEIAALNAALAEARAQAAALTERWEELESRREDVERGM